MYPKESNDRKLRDEVNYVGYSVKVTAENAIQPTGGYLSPNKFKHEFLESVSGSNKLDLDVPIWVIAKSIKYLMSEKRKKTDDHFFAAMSTQNFLMSSPIFLYSKNLQHNIKLDLSPESISNTFKYVIIGDKSAANSINIVHDLQAKQFNKDSIDCVYNFINTIGKNNITRQIHFSSGCTRFVTTDSDDLAKYLTNDTFYVVIASNDEPFDEKITLRLLMYYLIGLHSYDDDQFKPLQYLAVYDLCTNSVYKISINDIAQNEINNVIDNILGYNDKYSLINDLSDSCFDVKDRVKTCIQPVDGFVKPASFKQKKLNIDTYKLAPETIDPRIVNATIRNLIEIELRNFNSSNDIEYELGSLKLNIDILDDNDSAYHKDVINLSKNIQPGLSDKTIASMIKLIHYEMVTDLWIDDSIDKGSVPSWLNVDNISNDTITNVRIIVKRIVHLLTINNSFTDHSINVFIHPSRIIKFSFCNYVTTDTVWAIIGGKHAKLGQNLTLKLLIEYLMGLHSNKDRFKAIKYLGIYNYRTDTVYRLEISKIDPDIIDEVNTSIIGYDK